MLQTSVVVAGGVVGGAAVDSASAGPRAACIAVALLSAGFSDAD